MAEVEGNVYGMMHHRHYHESRDRDCRRDDKWIEQNIADGVSALREAVPEVKNAISDKVNAAMSQENANARAADNMMCGMERNLAEGQREIQRDVVDNKHAIKEVECNVNKEVIQNRFEFLRALDSETDMIKLQINNFERSVDKQFCDVKGEIKDSERRILDRLTSDKLDEKNDIIARLRAKCERSEDQLNFSNQQNKLESMINSIAQEQKFQSKVSQFGIGNVALPTQTANQG